VYGVFTLGHCLNVTVVNETLHTFLPHVMQKVTCQMWMAYTEILKRAISGNFDIS